MDKQAEELANDIPGAKVERLGEGILVTFESGVLFDVGSDEPRASARRNLRNLAASLQKYPRTHALLVGHTDSVGAESYREQSRRVEVAIFASEQYRRDAARQD